MASISLMKPSLVNLSPLEFTQLSNRPLLIDVRSQLEYATGHAPGAINLSLPRILIGRISWLRKWILPQWFRDLPQDQPIAVICLTSHRSPIAADFLIKSGFEAVFNITGGMVEWRQLKLEIAMGKT
ncbi:MULTISPECIES: rhodanese-like domain-containing protein [Kamptonema]|uniref:rhodanese-like domain-containing protein n=1 Tax=Kamptonema TaxID=1501433 RepID=UPI0001DACABA|nr:MULTISPECIES: rhodanese-like domain-containing protein [Kamptonema]CBN55608.1 Rhodanese-related sulfurtransferase [Kamptonema sp. PCC 6506]